ncbi:MAG: ATP-binding cassette domain-containing protein [Clostridiales bacterium]|nr:ATP-binding cassette domain-containing protein [Clostridiales bacterium]
MGLYTEVIRERERKDNELVRKADYRMMHRMGKDDPAISSGGAQFVVAQILSKFGLETHEVSGCSDIVEMLDLMLDPLGVIYDAVDLTDPDWLKRTQYLLGFRDDGEAVLLSPAVSGYRYTCPADGAAGRVSSSIKLQPQAYAIYRPIRLENANMVTMAVYVLRLVSMRDVVAIAAAAMLTSLLGMVAPKMNQVVLEEIVPMGMSGYSILMKSLGLFLAAGIVKAAITAGRTIFLGKMRVRISSEAQSAVMAKVLLLPQNYFMNSSTGKLSKQIANARFLTEQMINFFLGASLTAVFSLVYIPQMASFSRLMLLPAIVVLVIKSAYTLVAGRFFATNERKRQEAEMDQRAFMYTALKGIQRIKESGAEKRIYAKWTSKYQSVLACDLDQPAVLKLEDVAIGFLSSLGTVILLSLIVPGGIAKSDYIAFTSAFALITSAVTDLMDAQRKLLLMKPMMAQLKGILDAAAEDDETRTILRKVRGDIRIENVSFTYEDSSFGTLDDVSLHISPGEKIAIVGESGCGKSTLLKLILGIIRPSSGGIFIDGKPIDSIHLRAYRRHIGTVFQFSKVMPGTILSNIAFCPHPVSREEAEEAAQKADIADTINALPLGYDTEISDSNSGGFSGGQRQRLLLARAFASKPSIMILDEATSALDNISQSKVLKSVYAEKCTVIMVAHRLSTVKGCDRIVLLKDGRIAESGNFDELMDLKGEFYELMRRQEG